MTTFPTYIILDEDGVVRDRRTGWNTDTMTSIDDVVKKALKARRSETARN